METPSPKIAALLSHIEKTLAEIPSGGVGVPADDRLLFLGSWQVTLPMLILHDPVLSSDAKVLWGVIKSYADPRTIGAMPDYKTLRTGVRVNSNNTLRAALMELRAIRLISIYRRPRTLQGRFSGHLYLLYDEPLTLADALCMDPGYVDFLREARGHARRDVRTLANAILATLDEQLDQDKDVLAQPASPLERHADRHQAYQVLGGMHSPGVVPDDNPFFPGGQASFVVVAQQYSQDKGPGSSYENYRDQNLTLDQKMTSESENDPVSDSDTGNSGGRDFSNYFNNTNKKTTTTPTPPPEQTPSTAVSDLAWPDSLSQAEREVCLSLLDAVPRQWWQSLLDELEGRICWGKANADPLRNRPRWLKAVCDEVTRDGVFTPVLGDAIKLERGKRQKLTPSPKPAEPAKPIDRETAKAALAQIREVMR